MRRRKRLTAGRSVRLALFPKAPPPVRDTRLSRQRMRRCGAPRKSRVVSRSPADAFVLAMQEIAVRQVHEIDDVVVRSAIPLNA